MSGIAVVIDDAYEENGSTDSKDKIFQLVENIEYEWKIPFYKTPEIPSGEICNNLLQSASFILLDWKLWENSVELEKDGIRKNINFLKKARDYFIPVFIFTNENKDDIANAINDIYDPNNPQGNFIFIKNKSELIPEFSELIKDWLQRNASVYTLKTWEQAFYKAKSNLFSSMYGKSPDWPKVFWQAYADDHVDPSSSMTRLINDSLLSRIETGLFKKEYLGSDTSNIPPDAIKSVIAEASLIQKDNLPESEVRAGDLFTQPEGKYLLNIRPDCDCIPRGNDQKIEDVELYCIQGKRLREAEVSKLYSEGKGHLPERVYESIGFAVHESKTIKFKFQTLCTKKFSEVRERRVGRLTHPYITRIQQRYSSYLQRQGLPRIPQAAISPGNEE